MDDTDFVVAAIAGSWCKMLDRSGNTAVVAADTFVLVLDTRIETVELDTAVDS